MIKGKFLHTTLKVVLNIKSQKKLFVYYALVVLFGDQYIEHGNARADLGDDADQYRHGNISLDDNASFS